jgi:hypothetical protein
MVFTKALEESSLESLVNAPLGLQMKQPCGIGLGNHMSDLRLELMSEGRILKRKVKRASFFGIVREMNL